MERLGWRRRDDIDKSPESDEFKVQAKHLRQTLKKLKLDDIEVRPYAEERDARYFKRRRTLGYVGSDDIVITILVSSGTKRFDLLSDKPVTPMLIFPTDGSSGILQDTKSGKLYSDSFWVCEDGTFKYIKPTQPVPIDVIDGSYNQKKDGIALWPLFLKHKELLKISNDKQYVKELLAEAGIRVPNGIDIGPKDEDIEERIDAFLVENEGKECVVKANGGSQGKDVILFGAEFGQSAKEYAKSLLEDGKEVLLEERIIPPNVPGLFDKFGDVDYNFRIVTTLDPIKPRTIDGEIRHQDRGYEPVNVSQRAEASRLGELRDPALVEKINEVAEAATKVICEQVSANGEKMHGVAGVDLMLDEDMNIYVIEVNTGHVGGFSTLAKLDKKPLSSIRDVLIPSALDHLEDNFCNRIEVDQEGLSEIPVDTIDKVVFYDTCLYVGNYELAQEALFKNVNMFGKAGAMTEFDFLAEKLGSHDRVLRYAEEVLKMKESNGSFDVLKVRMLRKLKRYDEARIVVEDIINGGDLQGLQPTLKEALMAESFLISLKLAGEEKWLAVLMESSTESEAYEWLALGHRENGDRKKARHCERKAKKAKQREEIARRLVKGTEVQVFNAKHE